MQRVCCGAEGICGSEFEASQYLIYPEAQNHKRCGRIPIKNQHHAKMGLVSKIDSERAGGSDDSSLLERHKSTILVDGLEGAAAQLEADELAQLRNPDALGLEIWRDRALHHFRDVTTDTTLFLGQTRTVNFAARADAGSSDTTNTGHNKNFLSCGTRRMAMQTNASRRILIKFYPPNVMPSGIVQSILIPSRYAALAEKTQNFPCQVSSVSLIPAPLLAAYSPTKTPRDPIYGRFSTSPVLI